MAKDNLAVSIGLACKLGSLIVHAEEGRSAKGHAFDWHAFDAVLAEPDVQAWLKAMQKAGLLPVKR